jgi:transcriptional regulator of aromatic amino acid metabolism
MVEELRAARGIIVSHETVRQWAREFGQHVLTIDARGKIQSINPAVEGLFSRPTHQIIGRDVSELIEDDLLRRLKPPRTLIGQGWSSMIHDVW